MRAAQTIAQDIRIANCKHERLRRALEFRPVGVGQLEVATPALAVASAETSLQTVTNQLRIESSSSREHRRTLFGVVGLFSLACGWFLCGSVASIDFSSFEGDLGVPQVVSQTTVSPA